MRRPAIAAGAHSRCLQSRRVPPRATVQEENSTEMNVAVSHGKKSQVGADVGRFGHVGTTTKRNDEIEVAPSPNPNPNCNPHPSPPPHT